MARVYHSTNGSFRRTASPPVILDAQECRIWDGSAYREMINVVLWNASASRYESVFPNTLMSGELSGTGAIAVPGYARWVVCWGYGGGGGGGGHPNFSSSVGRGGSAGQWGAVVYRLGENDTTLTVTRGGGGGGGQYGAGSAGGDTTFTLNGSGLILTCPGGAGGASSSGSATGGEARAAYSRTVYETTYSYAAQSGPGAGNNNGSNGAGGGGGTGSVITIAQKGGNGGAGVGYYCFLSVDGSPV